ncbi:PD-(D/E)XK nuclease family protein [Saccharopolyspora taberi]
MTVLDGIEHDFLSEAESFALLGSKERGSRRVHSGVLRWTEHAVQHYLTAFPPGNPDLNGEYWQPVRSSWTYEQELSKPDRRGVRSYRIRVWGRCYRSADGRVNELRMMSYRRDGRKRATEEVAIAAHIAANAQSRPERVRVREFTCLDGETELLYEGTPEQVGELYREFGAPALAEVVDGSEYRPGEPCVKCLYRVECPGLPSAPGVLGISDRSRPRRTWSVTNGRNYRACPAKDFLRRMRLPLDQRIERVAAAERGRALHDHLLRKHAADSRTPCAARAEEHWSPRPLPPDEAEAGAAMLRHHSEVCPLLRLPPGAVLKAEPGLVFDDTDADVVLLVTPDLLYQDRGSWVWREVKTTRGAAGKAFRTLESVPQIALAIVLLGRGLLGGSRARSRVELEVLRPDGVDLRLFDPFDRRMRAEAAEVVHGLVRDWHRDDEFTPRPSSECRSCEVRRWCPAALPETAG